MLCFHCHGGRGSCSVWLLAECTVHVEMSGKRMGVGGTQETGKRKCQLLRGQDRGESEESAVTRLMDGLFDMLFCFCFF